MFFQEQMYLSETIGSIDMETETKARRLKTNQLITTYDFIKRYILVGWPEIQDYMEHPRWKECIFCIGIEGHECPDSTYAVPESLYKEINEIP